MIEKFGIEADQYREYWFDEKTGKMLAVRHGRMDGVEHDITLTVYGQPEGESDVVQLAKAHVEMFTYSEYLVAADAHSQEFTDLAMGTTRMDGTLYKKYRLPTKSAGDTCVAILTNIETKFPSLTEEIAHGLLCTIWTILNDHCPAEIEALFYDPYWDTDESRAKNVEIAKEAGFRAIDDDPDIYYLSKPQEEITDCGW